MKVRCNHRSQRRDFRFVKIRSVASLTKIRSVASWFLSRELSFREDSSCYFTHEDVMLHDLSQENFTLWRSYFTYSRISTSNSLVEAERLIECQLVSQNSEREICCARDSESSSLRLIERFRAEDEIVTSWIALKTTSSQIDRSCFFLLVDRFVTSVKFTSFVTMKIKYNVKERVWLEVTITETWIFDLKSKYVHEDRKVWSKRCASSRDHVSSHMNFRW